MPEAYTIIKDIMHIAIPVVAIWLGYAQSKSWKKKMVGKDEYAIAKRMILAAKPWQRKSVTWLENQSILPKEYMLEVKQTIDAITDAFFDAQIHWKDELTELAQRLESSINDYANTSIRYIKTSKATDESHTKELAASITSVAKEIEREMLAKLDG